MELITGERPEEKPPVRIVIPGDPDFRLNTTRTSKAVTGTLILPKHFRIEAESEFEGLNPQQTLEKLLEENEKDITKIQRLPDSLLNEAQKPAREREMMSVQERKDSTDQFSEVIFEAKVSGELFDIFDEDFPEIAKTLPKETYIPCVIQTKPNWKKVFFHPVDGHQVAKQEK